MEAQQQQRRVADEEEEERAGGRLRSISGADRHNKAKSASVRRRSRSGAKRSICEDMRACSISAGRLKRRRSAPGGTLRNSRGGGRLTG